MWLHAQINCKKKLAVFGHTNKGAQKRKLDYTNASVKSQAHFSQNAAEMQAIRRESFAIAANVLKGKSGVVEILHRAPRAAAAGAGTRTGACTGRNAGAGAGTVDATATRTVRAATRTVGTPARRSSRRGNVDYIHTEIRIRRRGVTVGAGRPLVPNLRLISGNVRFLNLFFRFNKVGAAVRTAVLALGTRRAATGTRRIVLDLRTQDFLRCAGEAGIAAVTVQCLR